MQLTCTSGEAKDWTAQEWQDAVKSGTVTVSGSTITWTTTGTAFEISLPDGSYSLVEDSAPAGYEKITKFDFTIDQGEVTESSTEEVTINKTDKVITAFDKSSSTTPEPVYDVTISKEDTVGNQVVGAKLSVTSKDKHDLSNVKVTRNGSPITVTLSADKHTITFETGNVYSIVTGLKGGTYILKEVTAPAGYLTAASIEFKIDPNGITYNGKTLILGSPVVMIDKADPSYKTKGKKKKSGGVPATGVGVSASNVAAGILITASVAAMGTAIVLFKKKKSEES
jgi:hypothetical protein